MQNLVDKAQQLCKAYQKALNTSLLLRTRVEQQRKGSKEYTRAYYAMLNAETRCQELDMQLYELLLRMQPQIH